MFSTPTLRTDRLLLVPPLMHEGMDVSYFVDWLNNPKVVKFSEQRHLKHTRHTQYDYLSTFDGDNSFLWEIRRLNSPIGTISAYRNKPNRIANMGVMIGSTDYWGRSFASEAWEAVSNWLFSDGVRKLEAGCMANNKAMIKVLEKNEFVYEGRQSQHFLLDGKPEDAVYYGKIKKADIIPVAGRNGGHQGILGSTG